MSLVIDSLIASLFWFPFILTTGITYKYLKVIDISIDGVAIISGIIAVIVGNMFESIFLSILAAMITGIMGGILFIILSKYYKIDPLITGIIISLFLYSLSVILVGESITIQYEYISTDSLILLSLLINLFFIFFVYLFFKTKLGLMIKAISHNSKITVGRNPNILLMFGHMFSGAILGIASSLYVHWETLAHAGGSFDFMLTSFTSLLAASSLLLFIQRKNKKFENNNFYNSMLIQAIIGTIFFQFLIYSIIFYSPLPNMWKLILSIILFLSLAKFKTHQNLQKDILSYTSNELVVRNLKKSFFNSESERIIFSHVNLTFSKGLNIIIGANGSGKSTFLKCLSGDLSTTNGSIFFKNKNITNIPIYQKPIFKINQEPKDNLVDNLYNYENISLNIKGINNLFTIINQNKIRTIIKQKLDKNLLLNKIFLSKAKYLSGGEAQYLSLFIASNTNKEILILDEPTSNLDLVNQKKIILLLEEIAKDKILIIVTHDIILINKAKNVFKIEKGKIKHVKES